MHMSYEQFIEKITEVLKEKTGGQVQLSVETVTKNNGCQRKGIIFSEEDSNISPVIYLEESYGGYLHGCSLDTLAKQILKMYYKVRGKHTWVENSVMDYQAVKDKIIYKLVNRDRNRELLKRVPYMEYLDLAVLYYVLAEEDEKQMATILIQNEHLDRWKVTAEEIRQRAEVNTERLLPYEINAACTMLGEMPPDGSMDEEQESMYVLTNHAMNGGASVILYPGKLEEIREYFKEDFYILPCSIHEVIVIPESKAIAKEKMERIVKEVNEMQIQPEEFLSNHIYYYDWEDKVLRRA